MKRFFANESGNGYTAMYKLALKGSWRLQATHPADAQNAAASSGFRSITVR